MDRQTLHAAVTDAPGIRTGLVDVDQLLSHTPRPGHLVAVVSSRGLEDVAEAQLHHVLERALPVPDLTLEHIRFVNTLTATLGSEVAGYAFELRRSGTTMFIESGGSARLPPDPTPTLWGHDVRMHVASCSKLITAIALTRLLAARGISPDSPIVDHLPAYWAKGPRVDTITFTDLLTHRSGFVTDSSSDFGYMKGKVAAGVPATGSYSYANMNFGLGRILVATLTGDIDPQLRLEVVGADLSDTIWDMGSVNSYAAYVSANVFGPSGVAGPTLDHPAPTALAYQRPAAVPGWDSGDLRSMSGGAGWHMSCAELLDVMGALRRRGSIVPVDDAQAMLDRGFGVDQVIDSRAGRLYVKNGYWMDANGHAEQACLWFLPEDLELVVLANSPFGSGAIANLRDAVSTAYTSCLVPRRFPIRGVLLLGGFRRQSELDAMSTEDMRNTLIVELTQRTAQRDPGYQGFDDDQLAGAGAALVALRRARIRDDQALRTMTADDMRNTLIVELDAQTGAGRRLQGFTDLHLAGILLGDDLATRGIDLRSVPNWTRGVLLVGGFRSQRELVGMSPEDMRNTLIVELTAHSNQTDYQALTDHDLAGAGAVMVAMRELGIRTDAQLRTMSSDDQRNTLIVELDRQTHLGRALQGLSNLRLAAVVLGL